MVLHQHNDGEIRWFKVKGLLQQVYTIQVDAYFRHKMMEFDKEILVLYSWNLNWSLTIAIATLIQCQKSKLIFSSMRNEKYKWYQSLLNIFIIIKKLYNYTLWFYNVMTFIEMRFGWYNHIACISVSFQ